MTVVYLVAAGFAASTTYLLLVIAEALIVRRPHGVPLVPLGFAFALSMAFGLSTVLTATVAGR